MRILGIDPGLNATGYGLIDAIDGRPQLVTAGVIRPSARKALAQRILELHTALEQAINTYHPQLTVLEAVFTHHQYVTTAALMAHARGVACLVSAQHGLPVTEYLPTRIKKALTGYGTASKEQVARAVGMWLGGRDLSWSSDTTDALALAIAHAHISRSSQVLGLQVAPRRRSRGRLKLLIA